MVEWIIDGKTVLVDDDVSEMYKSLPWILNREGYATAKVNGTYVSLHRLANQTPDGMYTDHINRNPLDNRRENLRSCTPSQNTINRDVSRQPSTSIYRGVFKRTQVTKGYTYTYFWAKVKLCGKVVYRKAFKDELEAAQAYDSEAKRWHGEFAVLNFPD